MTETNLAQLFSDGLSKIQTRKCDNLFKDLDDRNLTEAEESIIAQRVDLQRRMLEEYEKREKARKVREILDVCPDLTEEEAECALKMHGYKEEDAAAALTSGIAFRRKVQAMCGNSRPQPGTAVPPARLPAPQCHDWPRVTMVGPVGARPTGDFLKHIGDGVFVGTFKGKGWEMYKSRPLPQLKTSAAVPLNNASQTLPQKKRGRPPGRPASAQLCPPRPRSTKRHALRSSNAEPSPSTPPAARRRRSGRLNPSGARSPAPEEPELPKRQLEDSDELIAAAPESGFKPRSLPVKAPVLEQQEKVEKASQRPHDATESGTSRALEEVGQSCSNKYHKFPAHSHEGTEQNASHPPPHPLSPSPQSPTASQEPRAVPRRQRGSRRSKQGTPRLPWKQGGEQADVDGASDPQATVL